MLGEGVNDEEDVGGRGERAEHSRDFISLRVIVGMAALSGLDPEIIRCNREDVRTPSETRCGRRLPRSAMCSTTRSSPGSHPDAFMAECKLQTSYDALHHHKELPERTVIRGYKVRLHVIMAAPAMIEWGKHLGLLHKVRLLSTSLTRLLTCCNQLTSHKH